MAVAIERSARHPAARPPRRHRCAASCPRTLDPVRRLGNRRLTLSLQAPTATSHRRHPNQRSDESGYPRTNRDVRARIGTSVHESGYSRTNRSEHARIGTGMAAANVAGPRVTLFAMAAERTSHASPPCPEPNPLPPVSASGKRRPRWGTDPPPALGATTCGIGASVTSSSGEEVVDHRGLNGFLRAGHRGELAGTCRSTLAPAKIVE